jgi:hypothetical protein
MPEDEEALSRAPATSSVAGALREQQSTDDTDGTEKAFHG